MKVIVKVANYKLDTIEPKNLKNIVDKINASGVYSVKSSHPLYYLLTNDADNEKMSIFDSGYVFSKKVNDINITKYFEVEKFDAKLKRRIKSDCKKIMEIVLAEVKIPNYKEPKFFAKHEDGSEEAL